VLAGEDLTRVADECGRSTTMVHRHDRHDRHDLDIRHEWPSGLSVDGAVREALRARQHPSTA
jgi:hypothetical protein